MEGSRYSFYMEKTLLIVALLITFAVWQVFKMTICKNLKVVAQGLLHGVQKERTKVLIIIGRNRTRKYNW